MKLPWDKKYLKISFHVIFTLIVLYILKIIIDSAAFIIKDIKNIFLTMIHSLEKLLSLFSVFVVALIIAYLLDSVVDFFQRKYEEFIKNSNIKQMKAKKNNRINVVKENLYNTKLGKRFYKSKNNEEKLSNEKENGETRKFKRRMEGTILTYIILPLGITCIIYFLINNIGGNFSYTNSESSFSQRLANIIDNIADEGDDLIKSLDYKVSQLGLGSQFSNGINNVIKLVQDFLYGLAGKSLNIATSVSSGAVNFILSLVIAFYFLRDKEKILYTVKEICITFLPKKLNTRLNNVFADLNAVFSGYIKGQIIDAILLGTLVGVGLNFIGVKLAVFIGVITGFSSLMPFIGAIVAFILAVGLEMLLGSYVTAIKAAIVIFIIQQLDSIFIVPKVVGSKVHLSAPLVLLSISVGGKLFGILGMLFAVPICAVIKIFLNRFYRRYQTRKIEPTDKKSNNIKKFIDSINE